MKTEQPNLFDNLSVQDLITDNGVDPFDVPNPDPQTDPEEDETEDQDQDTPQPEPQKKDPEKPAPQKKQGNPKPEEPKPGEGDQEDDTDESVVSYLQKKFGFDFQDQQFEESADGIFELSRAAAERIAETQLDEFFQQMPVVADFAEYVMNGGEPAKFFETINQAKDYSQVQITEEDTASQKHVVSELLRRQGFDQDTIGAMLENYSKNNVMFDQAKAALPILAKLTAGEKQRLIEDQKKAAIEREKQVTKELQEVQSLVKTGTFKGIQIPEAEKSKFNDWMFKRGKDGKTARNAAREQLSMEDKLALEYLVYKGFKLSDIIQKRVDTQKTKDMKHLLKDKTGNRMKDDSTQRQELNIPSISDLFG